MVITGKWMETGKMTKGEKMGKFKKILRKKENASKLGKWWERGKRSKSWEIVIKWENVKKEGK